MKEFNSKEEVNNYKLSCPYCSAEDNGDFNFEMEQYPDYGQNSFDICWFVTCPNCGKTFKEIRTITCTKIEVSEYEE